MSSRPLRRATPAARAIARRFGAPQAADCTIVQRVDPGVVSSGGGSSAGDVRKIASLEDKVKRLVDRVNVLKERRDAVKVQRDKLKDRLAACKAGG